MGEGSQSIQFAPFDASYEWNNATYMTIDDPTISYLNLYQGSILQQVCSPISLVPRLFLNLVQTGSVITRNNQQAYTGTGGLFAKYGFEYKPGFESEGGYV